METHGLSPNPAPNGALPSLPDDVPAMRVELRDRSISAVNGALVALTGASAEWLVGRHLVELWPAAERGAIEHRFEDVVLLGHDAFGPLALEPQGGPTVWVEVDARFLYQGGQRVEVMLRPIDPPAAPRSPEPLAPPLVDLEADAEPEPDSEPDRATFALAMPTSAAQWVDEDQGATRAAPEPVEPAPEPVTVTEAPPAALPPAAEDRPATVTEAPLPVDGPAADGPPATLTEAAPSALRPAVEDLPPAQDGLADEAPAGGAMSLVMAALEAAGAAALAVARDGTITSTTPEVERLLGTPIARLRGTPFEARFALPGPAAEALAAARGGRTRQTVLADLADGDGRVVLEWVPGAEPGEGYAVLTTNAPESATAEKLRLQARLVSFVAHDVRESLAAVYCGLRTLSDEMPASAPERPMVERALAESRRANRIVEDVLAVSRPGRLTRVELELDAILADTVGRFRPRAAAHGVEFREAMAPGIRISADLSSLERAFGNLIENALQATPHYGTLTLTTALEDRARPGVRVSIADTGVGIPPEMRPNIFEPFVTGKPNGTGLGLAITRRVVLDHEGQIDLETEVGRGTTFHIWLPRLAP